MTIDIQDIKIGDIQPSKTNPRKHFDENSIIELAGNIQKVGQINPIVVRKHPEASGKFEIVAGERRYKACQSIKGMKVISCRVIDINDEAMLDMQIAENLQREDIDPMDEAHIFQQLIDSGNAVKDIAARVGKSETFVRLRLSLVKLIEPLQQLLWEGVLPVTAAYKLANTPEQLQKKSLDICFVKADIKGKSQTLFKGIRSVQQLLNDFTNELNRAPFDIFNKQLCPIAGSCTECPKRTGNILNLFDELVADDICLDNECFEDKMLATVEKTLLKATKDNLPVILQSRSYEGSSTKYQKIKELAEKHNLEIDTTLHYFKLDSNHVPTALELHQNEQIKLHAVIMFGKVPGYEEGEIKILRYGVNHSDISVVINNLPDNLKANNYYNVSVKHSLEQHKWKLNRATHDLQTVKQKQPIEYVAIKDFDSVLEHKQELINKDFFNAIMCALTENLDEDDIIKLMKSMGCNQIFIDLFDEEKGNESKLVTFETLDTIDHDHGDYQVANFRGQMKKAIDFNEINVVDSIKLALYYLACDGFYSEFKVDLYSAVVKLDDKQLKEAEKMKAAELEIKQKEFDKVVEEHEKLKAQLILEQE